MLFEALYLLKDIVIVLLLFAIFQTYRKAKSLEVKLEEEKRKRTMPLINLEVMTDIDPGLFLINDSYCYAKEIRISDLDFVIDYGFKKHITLKFPDVDILKPSGRTRLSYKVFDGEFDISAQTDPINILNHFSDAPLEMRLRYANIEGSPFASKITQEKNMFVVKDAVPLPWTNPDTKSAA